MKKIMLLGNKGQLGWYLNKDLPLIGNVYALNRPLLDFYDLKELERKIIKFSPDIIVNATGFTNVNLAELDKENAMYINAEVVGVLAKIAKKINAMFIHFSTDYVFNGLKLNYSYTENDEPSPINHYGYSKLIGEQEIINTEPNYLIFRTGCLYSNQRTNFILKTIKWLDNNDVVKIITDQYCSPTWSRELSLWSTAALNKIISSEVEIDCLNQIYHLTSSGRTNRFQLANFMKKFILEIKINSLAEIKPAKQVDFDSTCSRPINSVLDCKKFKEKFNIELPDWKVSLQNFLFEYYQS